MNQQMNLFEQGRQVKSKSFEHYDAENPHIYQSFKTMTLNLIKSGRDHYGAKSIIEVIRFHTITESVEYADGKDFKINNNYAPDYARKFMSEFPQYDGFFKTRELKKARR